MQAVFSMQRSVKKSKNILSFMPIPLGSTSGVKSRGRHRTITPQWQAADGERQETAAGDVRTGRTA